MFASILAFLASLAKAVPTLVAAGDRLYAAWRAARDKQELAAERKRLEAIDARAMSEREAIDMDLSDAVVEREKRAKALHDEWLAQAEKDADRQNQLARARSEAADAPGSPKIP